MKILRGLVHEPKFDAAIKKIFGSVKMGDTAMRGATDALGNDPYLLAKSTHIQDTPDGPLYAFKTTAFTAISSIVIYFTFHEYENGDVQIMMHDVIEARPSD